MPRRLYTLYKFTRTKEKIMTYVMSDLHGDYELYLKMLKRINFSEDDVLYILGDVMDRGDGGFKILFDVEERDNIILLAGNHDMTAHFILSRLDRPLARADIEEYLYPWLADGGGATLESYKALSKEDRAYALDILDGMLNYCEIEVGGKEYLLAHAGLEGYEDGKPLEEYPLECFIFYRQDYSKPIFKGDRYLVTGHTPTAAIEGAEPGRIYKKNNYIAIDCGATYGLSLGCICLETMEEFYLSPII